MINNKLPCTLAILTKDSGEVLKRALESVKDFADIVICDGGSTDDTLSIANKYGARIIEQDPQYLDENGKIKNFGGIRNQTLAAAKYDWFFFVDSDEYLGPELIEELRMIIEQGNFGVFWIPRRYVFNKIVIECATSYPSYQPRFFHKSVVKGFIKEVHERIDPNDGVTPQYLSNYMYVPVDSKFSNTFTKWEYYLGLEYKRRYPMSFHKCISGVTRELAIGILYLLRLVRIQIFCKGTKLPIRVELLRPGYQVALVWTMLKSIRRW